MNATLPASTISAIGQRVADLLSGKVALPGGMALEVTLPLTVEVESLKSSVLVSISPSQKLNREGFDPWIQSIEAFPSGRVLAHLSKGPFTFDRELSPATVPRLGLMGDTSPSATLVLAENPIVAKAKAAGHNEDVVRKALEAASREFPPAAAGRLRRESRLQRRAARERAITAGLVANGVPESYWGYAFGLLRIALTFVPYGSIISDILWVVDEWMGGQG